VDDFIINDNIDPTLGEIEKRYRMCKDFNQINTVLSDTRKMRKSCELSEDDWFKAEIIRKEVVEVLKK
jgi:hypothetical protein